MGVGEWRGRNNYGRDEVEEDQYDVCIRINDNKGYNMKLNWKVRQECEGRWKKDE